MARDVSSSPLDHCIACYRDPWLISDSTACRFGGVTIRLIMPLDLEPSESSMLASEDMLAVVSFEAHSVLCVITFGTEINEVGADDSSHLAPQPGQNCHLLDRLALHAVHTRLLSFEGLSIPFCFRDDDDRPDAFFRLRLDPENIPCRCILQICKYS